ncbi:hypothetical protein [Sphingobacterium gobiense]|uniref:Histidine kinase n=1 Tax=Sphingobacterium gobiense TaxID=1382456 RepID=A0A2S9JTP1_9SPHI|nr:hypothetical protein [Sphingobacterium gobiense]PRD56652.1 hypothetical protein C5749_05305 [Sphingobacterium gobiense]
MSNWIQWLDAATWSIPILLTLSLAALICYRKAANPWDYYVFAYLAIALIVDLSSRYWLSFHTDNLVFVQLYALAELMLVGIMYMRFFLTRLRKIGWLLLFFTGSFVTWEFAHHILQDTDQDFSYYQSYSRVVVSATLVTYGLMSLLQRVRRSERMDHQKVRLIVALTFYYSLNFIFYLPINFFVTAHTHFKFLLWAINLLVTNVFYIYLTLYLWRFGKKKKPLFSG